MRHEPSDRVINETFTAKEKEIVRALVQLMSNLDQVSPRNLGGNPAIDFSLGNSRGRGVEHE